MTQYNRNSVNLLKNKTVKRRKVRGGLRTDSLHKDLHLGSPILNKNNTGKNNKQEYRKRQLGGRGILTDLAIPAILLYANNTIGKRKTVRFSRKYK